MLVAPILLATSIILAPTSMAETFETDKTVYSENSATAYEDSDIESLTRMAEAESHNPQYESERFEEETKKIVASAVLSRMDEEFVEETETQAETQTEAQTETQTEAQTEVQTEVQTEAQAETEAPQLMFYSKIGPKDYSWVEPESDLWLIAKVICGEAQYCDRIEMEYVASVILNRVADPRFPNTIREVVYQPGQYSCTCDGNWGKEPTQANWEEAEYILNMFNEYGYTVLPADVVWQSKSPQGNGTYIVTSWGHYYCY